MPKILFNLIFDSATEQAIQALWSHIEHAGITEPVPTRYPPHITLAIYDVESASAYAEILAPIASSHVPFPVLLESLGVFPENGVIFLAPRMSHTLFSLHRTTIQAFASMDEANKSSLVADMLLPDHWVPHATLAKKLTPAHTLKGLEVCLQHWTPLRGLATGIGMRVFPAKTVHRYYPFNK